MPASEFVVEGQEPTPLSPVDNEIPTFRSIDRRNSREITLPLPPSSNLPGAQPQPFPPPHLSMASFITPTSPEAEDVFSITQRLEDASMRPPTPLAELSAEEVHHTIQTSEEEGTTKSDSTGGSTGGLLSPNGTSHEGHEVSTSEQPEMKKHQQEKSHDPAVLYSIPITPSAAAYEAAENNPNEGYFKPEFPEGAITPTPEETTV